MDIEELSKGQLNKKRIIDTYNRIIGERGVDAAFTSRYRLYSLVSEEVKFSESYVEQTILKYMRGEIKYI